jgi:hypothetical protein
VERVQVWRTRGTPIDAAFGNRIIALRDRVVEHFNEGHWESWGC